METFTLVLGEIVKDVMAGFKEIASVIFKFLKLFIWALIGVFVLACVFVANVWYPKWEKWAENLKK